MRSRKTRKLFIQVWGSKQLLKVLAHVLLEAGLLISPALLRLPASLHPLERTLRLRVDRRPLRLMLFKLLQPPACTVISFPGKWIRHWGRKVLGNGFPHRAGRAYIQYSEGVDAIGEVLGVELCYLGFRSFRPDLVVKLQGVVRLLGVVRLQGHVQLSQGEDAIGEPLGVNSGILVFAAMAQAWYKVPSGFRGILNLAWAWTLLYRSWALNSAILVSAALDQASHRESSGFMVMPNLARAWMLLESSWVLNPCIFFCAAWAQALYKESSDFRGMPNLARAWMLLESSWALNCSNFFRAALFHPG